MSKVIDKRKILKDLENVALGTEEQGRERDDEFAINRAEAYRNVICWIKRGDYDKAD